MKQDDFFKRLDEHLADLEVSSPNDLWEDIETTLESQSLLDERKASHFTSLKRWVVAAVFAGLMFWGGYLYWHNQPQEPQQISGTAKNDLKPEPIQPEPPIIASSTVQNIQSIQLVTKGSFDTSKEEFSRQENSPQESLQQNEALRESENHEEESVSHEGQLSFPESVRKMTAQLERKPEEHRRLSLGLYAAGSMGDLNISNGVLMSSALLNQYAFSRTRSAAVYLAGYEERQHHRQPISFGLTLDYQLNHRLSLSTGVVYTKLYSDFTSIMGCYQIKREQTLHYVGIPLNVNVGIWQYKGLQTYLSAGGQMDFNVKVDMNTGPVRQTMEKDRMQFSAAASLGIQYYLLPQMSVYAEPGIRHYFDNGSQVRNFFKDKPTSFNLQFGIRYSFNR